MNAIALAILALVFSQESSYWISRNDRWMALGAGIAELACIIAVFVALK